MINEFNDVQQREILVRRLGVFELRALAREVGIASPTTKKRDELVELILKSFENGINQEAKIQKRGRPFKKLNAIDDIIGSVIDDKKSKLSYDNVLSFAQEENPIVTLQGEMARCEGICRVTDKCVTIHSLQGNKSIFVGDIYGREKLVSGDLVEVTARRVNDNNEYHALSISLINGVSALSYQMKDKSLGEEIISNKTFAQGDKTIYEGRRNACLLDEDLYENDNFIKLYNECENQNVQMVVLGANVSYENQIMFKNINFKYNFITPYDTNAKENLNKIIDGMNFAENRLRNGGKVMLVVADLGGLLMGLDENFDINGDEHAQETKIIAKKLLSLAGAYTSKASLTLMLYYSEIDKSDKFINSDLLRICKKI